MAVFQQTLDPGKLQTFCGEQKCTILAGSVKIPTNARFPQYCNDTRNDCASSFFADPEDARLKEARDALAASLPDFRVTLDGGMITLQSAERTVDAFAIRVDESAKAVAPPREEPSQPDTSCESITSERECNRNADACFWLDEGVGYCVPNEFR